MGDRIGGVKQMSTNLREVKSVQPSQNTHISRSIIPDRFTSVTTVIQGTILSPEYVSITQPRYEKAPLSDI